MNNFVYRWNNITSGKSYIGIHQGDVDDGYVCSSTSTTFWEDFKNPTHEWHREILFEGTRAECIERERLLIVQTGFSSLYNLSAWPAWSFEGEAEERRLASIAKRRGVKFTEEHKRKLKEAAKDRVSPRKGQTLSEETKDKIRQKRLGSKHKPQAIEKVRNAVLGREVKKETRDKISQNMKRIWKERKNELEPENV